MCRGSKGAGTPPTRFVTSSATAVTVADCSYHAPRMAEIAFVVAPRQNSFFVEIVDAIRDELARAGVGSTLHEGAFPPLRDGLVYVLVPPHEWFALAGRRHPPTRAQLRRTVGICAEQPGTSFFGDDLHIGKELGALLDVNAAAIRTFRSSGLTARHFP